MSKNTEKVIGKIKDNLFSRDEVDNAGKSKFLTELKIKLQEKQFALQQEYEKERSKLLLSEKVQEGKNKAQREAILQLELEGTKFDKLEEYEILLNIIKSVEKHNENMLIMFFGKSIGGESHAGN